MSILPNESIAFPTNWSGTPGFVEVAGEHRGLARDLPGRLLGDVAVEVVDDDLRALRDEQLRGGAPDPACRTGHDRRLAVEYSHSRCVSSSWLGKRKLYTAGVDRRPCRAGSARLIRTPKSSV